MTTLMLSVTRGPSGSLNQTRMVSSGAFQVGRAQPSDWVLDDPRRVVSKRHCVFRQDERGWSVADVSRNGSFLARGNETVRLGSQPYRLESGEKLRFGDYELAVDLQEDESSFLRIPLAPGRAPPQGRVAMPPDVPPRAYPRPAQPHPGADEGSEPTRFMLHRRGASAREAASLPPLLEGAGLSPDDVSAPGREAEILRTAGAALRAAVSALRDLRFATLGEAGDGAETGKASGADGLQAIALPLVGARNDRDALLRLLSPEQVATPASIEAAFKEIRQHHDWLVRAARRSLRTMLESFDPDEPVRQLMPHWLDVLPGWRRWRGTVLARRRFRRLSANIDRTVDEALARAYWDVRREMEARWNPR